MCLLVLLLLLLTLPHPLTQQMSLYVPYFTCPVICFKALSVQMLSLLVPLLVMMMMLVVSRTARSLPSTHCTM